MLREETHSESISQIFFCPFYNVLQSSKVPHFKQNATISGYANYESVKQSQNFLSTGSFGLRSKHSWRLTGTCAFTSKKALKQKKQGERKRSFVEADPQERMVRMQNTEMNFTAYHWRIVIIMNKPTPLYTAVSHIEFFLFSSSVHVHANELLL